MLEWLKCALWRGHDWKFSRNLYGDQIISHGWKRSEWRCTRCRGYQDREQLHEQGN